MRSNKLSMNDVLVNIFLILLFLLPQSMILYLAVPIGILMVSNFSRNFGGKWSMYFLALIFILSFSLMANISETWVDSKSWMRALHLILIFLCFGKTKSTRIYKGTIAFIIIYLSVFQFAGVLHLTPIVNLSYILYPLSDKAELAFEQTLNMGLFEAGGFNERLFGIYHNANNCAIYIQLTLIMLLMERDQFHNNKYEKILYGALLALDVLGLVAAGSRTSFIVLVVIGLTLFSEDFKNSFGIIILVVCIFFVLVNIGLDLRMFKVQDGMSSSFGFKIQIVENYLDLDLSLFKLLFGCFSTQALVPLINTQFAGTDMDLGDMFVQYGLSFIVFIAIFLVDVFKSLKKEYRTIFCILLWMLSNTIICNYRTSSIVLFLMSIYVVRTNANRKLLKTN